MKVPSIFRKEVTRITIDMRATEDHYWAGYLSALESLGFNRLDDHELCSMVAQMLDDEIPGSFQHPGHHVADAAMDELVRRFGQFGATEKVTGWEDAEMRRVMRETAQWDGGDC